jgi:predicted CDP-diglyceride synthetase/phosphatidate cytidylyltransferase
MTEWADMLPPIVLALAAAVIVALVAALVTGRRGGRFRALRAWSGFWALFAVILVALSLAPRWVSFPMLALLMFATLRAYFSVAPVRPRDRYAILASYLAVPVALYFSFIGAEDAFLAIVPVLLFLVVPVFLAIGSGEKGMLDSMGRTILGVLFFVYCTAHLTLLVDQPGLSGLPELFGVFVLASDLPQRLAGRVHQGAGWIRVVSGKLASLALVVGVGFWLGPWCGLVEEDGGRAAALVFIAVSLGRRVSDAVADELALGPASRIGRGAILDRVVPALYAAPVFFHYINSFV